MAFCYNVNFVARSVLATETHMFLSWSLPMWENIREREKKRCKVICIYRMQQLSREKNEHFLSLSMLWTQPFIRQDFPFLYHIWVSCRGMLERATTKRRSFLLRPFYNAKAWIRSTMQLPLSSRDSCMMHYSCCIYVKCNLPSNTCISKDPLIN